MRRGPRDSRSSGDGSGRGATIEPKDADVDARVEQLARELAEAINDAEAGGRVVMRDYAIDLLRDSVGSEVADPSPSTAPTKQKPPLNPFALGIPFLLIGVVLTFIFTPVGAALLLLGTVTCLVGVVMAIFRSTRERWRSRDDVR
jgi:hypothetical protein